MGSPFWGRVCVVGLRIQSERNLRLNHFPRSFRDEVTLWVECGPRYTLNHEQKIYLVISPSSFRMKEFLGMCLWQHIAAPPPLFNVGTRVLYINHSGNVY